MVSGSGISGLSIGWRRSGIHSTEAASHFLEGMIWEELQLEEQEEAEEHSVGRDVRFVDEVEDFVGGEHLCELSLDSWYDCMFVIFHKHSFLDGEFRFLAVGSEEGRLSGVTK